MVVIEDCGVGIANGNRECRVERKPQPEPRRDSVLSLIGSGDGEIG